MKHLLTVVIAAVLLISCHGRDEGKIGSAKVPFRFAFMPAPDKPGMDANVKIIAEGVSNASGLAIEPVESDNFISIIDGMAAKKIDGAFLNSLGYLLAHDSIGAEAAFQLKGEDGRMVYRSAIIARDDSGIKSLEDLAGKSVAFTNAYSMAGYLMPLSVLTEKKIVPKEQIFLNDYSSVVEAVYNGRVDAGAIYYAEHDPDGRIHDARITLVNKYNDMVDKVVVIFKSDAIPATPIVLRKGLDSTVKKKIIEGFDRATLDVSFVAAINRLYGATGILPASEKSFDVIRDVLKNLNKDIKEVVPGAVDYYRKNQWEETPER